MAKNFPLGLAEKCFKILLELKDMFLIPSDDDEGSSSSRSPLKLDNWNLVLAIVVVDVVVVGGRHAEDKKG
jgi:hypothetical protein